MCPSVVTCSTAVTYAARLLCLQVAEFHSPEEISEWLQLEVKARALVDTLCICLRNCEVRLKYLKNELTSCARRSNLYKLNCKVKKGDICCIFLACDEGTE